MTALTCHDNVLYEGGADTDDEPEEGGDVKDEKEEKDGKVECGIHPVSSKTLHLFSV